MSILSLFTEVWFVANNWYLFVAEPDERYEWTFQIYKKIEYDINYLLRLLDVHDLEVLHAEIDHLIAGLGEVITMLGRYDGDYIMFLLGRIETDDGKKKYNAVSFSYFKTDYWMA